MSDYPSFLKYLIDEQLYLINDPSAEGASAVDTAVAVAPAQSKADVVKEAVTVEEESVEYQLPLKGTLILFENAQEDEMKAAEKAYLEKILGAVKLSWQEIESRNVINDPVDDKPANKKVIAFTANHGFGVVPPYQISQQGAQQILMAHDLATISASVDYRKQLWAALQQMFL